MPPIDFCNRSRPTSTPCELSEPGGRACEATTDRQPDPWQGRASRVVSNQGSTGDESPFRRPRSDRSPYGFTPTRLRLGHPHVARLTPPPTGKSRLQRSAVAIPPKRISSPWHTKPRPGHDRGRVAVRAAVPPLRANVAVVDCTQGAFHPSHPLVAALARSSARGGGRAGGFPRIGGA